MMKKTFDPAQMLFDRVRTVKDADEVRRILNAFEHEMNV